MLSAIIGIVFTYGVSSENDLVDVIPLGVFWGFVVGGSVAALIDSLFNVKVYKWNAVGWILVALGYGFWVSINHQGENEITIGELIYSCLLVGGFSTWVVGWLFVGEFLSFKMGNRV